jgi:alpha-tubulin suppressor-like RCC1 family protein
MRGIGAGRRSWSAGIGVLLALAALALSAAPALAKNQVSDVFGFGGDNEGHLGDGSKRGNHIRTTPVALPALGGVVQIVQTDGTGLALLDDSDVMAWGEGSDGQLGNGGTTSSSSAIPVPGLTGVTSVASGEAQLALRSDGTVAAWGGNQLGAVGDGTTTDKHVPVPVEGLSEVVGIAADLGHSLAVRSDGRVLEWGARYAPASGISDVPVEVPGISGAVAVSAGVSSALALLADGEVLTWGSARSGELGNGETEGEPVGPQRVCALGISGPCPSGPFLAGVAQVAGGNEFDAVRLEDGTVAAWGLNDFGELGTGSNKGPEGCGVGPDSCSSTPVAVEGLSGVTQVAVGEEHTLALLSAGGVEAWGAGGDGQLGNGMTQNVFSPEPVSALSGIVSIFAGGSDSYALGPQRPGVTKLKPGHGGSGTTVTVTGPNLLTATGVNFGATPAASFTVTSASTITATAPALAPGTYEVTVTSPSGTSLPAAKDKFKVR